MFYARWSERPSYQATDRDFAVIYTSALPAPQVHTGRHIYWTAHGENVSLLMKPCVPTAGLLLPKHRLTLASITLLMLG